MADQRIGGEGGIRTPGTVPRTLDFESSAFNRARPPLRLGGHTIGLLFAFKILIVFFRTPGRNQVASTVEKCPATLSIVDVLLKFSRSQDQAVSRFIGTTFWFSVSPLNSVRTRG